MPAENPKDVYQLKVTLRGTDPPIWRQLLVPADVTLAYLHSVLQLAMGWDDDHMHEFSVGRQRFGVTDVFADGPEVIDERTVPLSSVLARPRSKVLYIYDFGDDWHHDIVLEKVVAREPGRDYPTCVAGERRGPPEDCGGVPGYYDLLAVIGHPEHEDHEERLEWLGDGFDPEAFSVDEVNQRLARLQRHRKRAVK